MSSSPSPAHTAAPRLLARLRFAVIASNFLLKVVILNFAFLVYLVAADFETDLFVGEVTRGTFVWCVLIVNAMAYALYRGIASERNRARGPGVIAPSVNALVIGIVAVVFVAGFLALDQKVLSLSASLALLAIAANSKALSLAAAVVFAAGVPQAIALDEFIPLMFCAVLNIYVFLPWLVTRGRRLLWTLVGGVFFGVLALSAYYVNVRYNPFKLVERIFEQAAPLSWRGDPLLWFHPWATIGGMPTEREILVLEGTWDAQFKVTYLIVNAPLLGSAFLLVFAYLLGRFTGQTLRDCEAPHANVLQNFLKLKFVLVLVEVLGEKITDPGKLLAYVLLIGALALLQALWAPAVKAPRRATA